MKFVDYCNNVFNVIKAAQECYESGCQIRGIVGKYPELENKTLTEALKYFEQEELRLNEVAMKYTCENG